MHFPTGMSDNIFTRRALVNIIFFPQKAQKIPQERKAKRNLSSHFVFGISQHSVSVFWSAGAADCAIYPGAVRKMPVGQIIGR
jgi:hypothetical protein